MKIILPRLKTLAFCLLYLISGHAFAAKARYLDDSQLRIDEAVLVAPPAPGTAEDIADRTATFRAYTTRNKTQADLANDEAEHFNVFSFASVLGPEFNAQHLPRTAAVFDEIKKETNKAKNEAKNTWKRQRPCPVNACQWDPEADDKDWQHRDYGYPSGHATRAMVFAIVLSKVFPQRADALMNYARQVGWRRVVRGVHSPQDVYAARILAQALARDFLASPALQNDLRDVAHEVVAVGREPSGG